MYFSPMYRTLFTICLLVMASLLQAQNIQISGVVLDEAGEPLPGVSIQVKGTQRGTSSGVNGDFAIKAGPRATLVFSFIGYERREIELKGRSKLRVQLEPAVNQLEQVEVVVGYGSQRKEDLTGAISTLSGKELSEIPTVNLLDAIGSKIPGMEVLGFCPYTRCRFVQCFRTYLCCRRAVHDIGRTECHQYERYLIYHGIERRFGYRYLRFERSQRSDSRHYQAGFR